MSGMPTPRLAAGIPLLRIFDETLARAFYVDFLGFAVAWEHRFAPDLPLYAEIRRGGLTLHLTGHHGDTTPAATVFVPMTGIDALAAELAAHRHGHARPAVAEQDWGRELTVTDPFGNRLRFCQRGS